jgi:predicted nucleic acid-binding Zn ribbon protein
VSGNGPDGPAGPAGGPADREPAAPTGLERARRALAQAKADAAARGARPVTGSASRTGAERLPRAGRPRRDDPQTLGKAIDGLLADQGWHQRAAVGGAFGRWSEIVGPDVAAHAKPETFADGELTVVTDSTAWATQIRLLAPNLLRRLNSELGDGTVRRVRVRGPAASRPAPGERRGLRVRGGRGPRDTYG